MNMVKPNTEVVLNENAECKFSAFFTYMKIEE